MSAGSTNQEGLVLHNASVLTMDPTRPRGRVVEARGSRILGVGTEIDRSRGKEGKVTFLDCQGKTVVPGFVDAHTHFLAYASSLLSVDCTPSEVGSIEDVKAAIAARARETPEGSWIRGAGYDEFYLAEKRHPSAKDLDQATQQHPVKLIHRSGHACVLNSYALRLARISIETPEPLRGVIERQQETGEPTGLFLDLDQWLDERLKGSASQENIEKAVSKASERYLSMGITSLQDASPSNSLERWRLFDRLKREGWLVPRVSMMIGYCHIDEVVEAGLGFGSGDDDLRLGSAKVFLSQVGGSLSPSAVELIEVVQSASRLGFPVAVHAVEKVEVEAAIKALESAARSANPNLRHRIEHCSIAPPDLQERLARLNAVVVTQPGFVYYSGERYLRQVPREDVPWLYPIGSLMKRGARVAGSSDSPVAPPNPMVAVYAAVTRRASSGEVVGASEKIPAPDALKVYTMEGACAACEEKDKGSISPGKLADLVILSDDPTRVPTEAIKDIEVRATILGGKVVWQKD